MKQPTVENVMTTFLEMLATLKLLHWSTMKYGVHKALDDLHDKLSKNVDRFVECHIGRAKKQPLKKFSSKLSVHNDVSDLNGWLEQSRGTLRNIHSSLEKENQLQNIIEEMIADIDQATYLCQLV